MLIFRAAYEHRLGSYMTYLHHRVLWSSLRVIMLSCLTAHASFCLGWFQFQNNCAIWFISKESHPCPPTGTASLCLHLSHSHFSSLHHSSVPVRHPRSASCLPFLFFFWPFHLSPSLSFVPICPPLCINYVFSHFLCLAFSLTPPIHHVLETTKINVGLWVDGF